ncbi:dTDP-4-dehydrorhamnose 3,5-epimerase [Mucilaginibacter sp.]|uniref:dTDP-4-dehydrorhamnose 3,5-epimerase n=1 Tax=Mucilaginibacter sp. TaxID=1882438 RepID=UPI0026352291|nr:dTDP-4-dehydrorhamnose 3,5-epimerase [Mucilaginibacter sp.]MDB5032623.1 dTDP-4-dehydrorhamnose 3,5-epimerase [Mucilaginibacter sp.]
MKITETSIKGLMIIEPQIFNDGRGYFFESYSKTKFAAAGITIDFVQDNQSFSHKGAIRGLHAQSAPHAQAKLVRVIQGRVLDVVVDVRKESPTYGKYEAIELSGDNQLQFLIPEGFLHGFATLEDNTIFTYKVNDYYSKECEVGVRWNDPTLAINWGIAEQDALISPKDAVLPEFAGFVSPF